MAQALQQHYIVQQWHERNTPIMPTALTAAADAFFAMLYNLAQLSQFEELCMVTRQFNQSGRLTFRYNWQSKPPSK